MVKGQLAGSTFEVLTSTGAAAIAVIRARGPRVAVFAERHLRTNRPAESWGPGQVLRAALLDGDGLAIDDILVSVHAPPSAWDVRLHLHGNPWLVRRCGELLEHCGLAAERAAGARLWATRDTLEAEAGVLLPWMLTLRGAEWLLRQVELLRQLVRSLRASESVEEIRDTSLAVAGRIGIVDWFRNPLRVVLAGPPNAGKSTLANALADQAVCVVSPTPGTTRDWVEVPGEGHGFPVMWVDTAGVRQGGDALEAAAAARTRGLMEQADAVALVLDPTREAAGLHADFMASTGHLDPACVAVNKADLDASADEFVATLPLAWRSRTVVLSAARRTGLAAFQHVLLAHLGRTDGALGPPAAFTARQVEVLKKVAAESDPKAMQNKVLWLVEPESDC